MILRVDLQKTTPRFNLLERGKGKKSLLWVRMELITIAFSWALPHNATTDSLFFILYYLKKTNSVLEIKNSKNIDSFEIFVYTFVCIYYVF